MTKINKILVIGAGIAGPSMCYWLKKFGFSPTLIDNAPAIRKGGQALDIRGVAVQLVKEMGIYEDICNRRTQIERCDLVDTTGKLLHQEQGERGGFRQGDEVEIVRGDLVDILMSTIKDVPVHFNKSVQSVKEHDNGVTVEFKDGSIEEYDLMIGADGIHSATRRMVFDKDVYQLINLGSYISIFTIPNYLKLNHSEILCEANQKHVSITNDHDKNTASAGFMFRSSRILHNIRDKDEQMQFLRETFTDFGWETKKMLELMPDSHDFYFDSITQVKMDSWVKGRVALLGDAGYCASPLSGQGNNLALVGAYILAGELNESEGDYKHAFSRYDKLLRSFVKVTQEFGAWVSESFLIDGELSKDVAEERSNLILRKIKAVANGIELPNY